MDVDRLMLQMLEDGERVQTLVQGVSDQQARWKPDADSWSILEVVCHLLDEERRDFRVRLDYTLHRPGEPWPPIDPGGWVTERAYNEQDLEESLSQFLSERQASISCVRVTLTPFSRSLR